MRSMGSSRQFVEEEEEALRPHFWPMSCLAERDGFGCEVGTFRRGLSFGWDD